MFFLIGLSIFVVIALWITMIIFGIKLSMANNAVGVVLLFVSLNIIGLVIGLSLLHNSANRNPVIVNVHQPSTIHANSTSKQKLKEAFLNDIITKEEYNEKLAKLEAKKN